MSPVTGVTNNDTVALWSVNFIITIIIITFIIIIVCSGSSRSMDDNTYVIPLTNGIEGSHGSTFKVKTIWSDASVENIDVNACAIAYGEAAGRRQVGRKSL